MICSAVIIYLYQDVAITILFLFMGIISAFIARAISKYRVIIEEQELTVVYNVIKERFQFQK